MMKIKRKAPLPAKTGKKQDGRFQPGESGNPAGRPAGSRNKVSILLDGMLQEQAENILQKAIRMALKGDPQMIRALLDKLLPNKKDSPIKLTLPKMKTTGDLSRVTAALLQATGSGKLTPLESAALAKIVDTHRAALEMVDIEKRISILEKEIKNEARDD